MRILVFLAIFTFTFLTVTNIDSNTNTLPIIAAYDFETIERDQNGLYVPSHSVHEIHGYLHQNATILNEGKHGKVLALTGKGHLRASVNHIPNFITRPFSIVAHVRMPAHRKRSDLNLSLKAMSNKNEEGTRTLWFLNDGRLIMFGGLFPAPGIIAAQPFGVEFGNHDLVDNSWHHIAYVYSKNDVHTVYVDSKLVSEEQRRTPSLLGFDGKLDTITIYIGEYNKFGETFIDEVGFFGYELNSSEIKYISDNGIAKFLNPPGTLTTTWAIIKTLK